MKRSQSSSPGLSSSPAATPQTPVKKARKAVKDSDASSTETPSPKKTKKQKVKDEGANGQWTPEKRAGLAEDIFATGYKHVNVEELCQKVTMDFKIQFMYGLTRAQITNQLTPGRHNLRSKLVKAAGGE